MRCVCVCVVVVVVGGGQEVLLVHELDALVSMADAATFARIHVRLGAIMTHCISSDYARIAERCLAMWKGPK